jgi:hypothetical protein
MSSLFFARPSFKRLVSSALMGIGAVAIGGNALADVSSWVSTTAPDIVPDPGAAGPLSTYEVEYSDGATSSTVGRHGYLVAPTDALAGQEAVKRPVVVFLHGSHATCLINGVPSDPSPYTNCPAANRVPSYKGYLAIQRRLATRGYISISIDANEAHGDLPGGPDQHLSLLSSWADAAPSTFLMWVARNTDFNKVVLVGHSVGAASVDTAAYQNKLLQTSGTPAPKWRVAGEVLISGGFLSPTAYAVGVHTLRWMSGCDSISSWNANAQQSLDGNAHHDQVTLRSSMLVRGANHNYSNSVWTDNDDDYGTMPALQDLECRLKDANGQPIANPPVRLSISAQQSIVKAYVTAAVAAFVSDDTNAWKAIDGTPGHMPSSGVAGATGPEIRVSGKGRRRNDFVQFAFDKLNVSGTGNMLTGICSSSNSATDACVGPNASGALRNQFLIGTSMGSEIRPLVSAKWAALGGQISITHKSTYEGGLLDVMLAGRQLGLRIAQLPTTALTVQQPITMNVKLRDVGGHILDLGNVTVNPLATLANVGPVWAQEVRLPVPRSTSFDFTSVVSLDLTPLSPASGQFWVADVFGYYPNN